ncbi:hypothetical protein EVAR_12147_1 [Eumeta japonica]|uniref:DUF4780 domain-containing protein n=1 Tax=Eumeta variegata TaxID=151549 RepID=A0A4C1UHQ4_EUMVA|nr:hypothetical protein EVAR_12147_1 [Eumeta japonica]
MILFHLYEYHQQNVTGFCSRTDFLKYGFCLPGYLGIFPENIESALWLKRLDIGKLNRQELICFGGETDHRNSMRLTMCLKSAHSATDQETVLKNLEICNRRVDRLNVRGWTVSSYKDVGNGIRMNIEMDVDSAKALSDNKFELEYIDCDALFTHEYDDIDALINSRKAEQTDIYDVTNMELASDDDDDP